MLTKYHFIFFASMQFANKPSHFYAVNMAKSVCHILSKKSVISIIAPKVGQICLSAIIIKYSWKLNKNTFSKLSLYWVQDEDFRYKRDTRNYEYTMNQFPHRNTFYCHFYFFFRVSKFLSIYIHRMQSIKTKNFYFFIFNLGISSSIVSWYLGSFHVVFR